MYECGAGGRPQAEAEGRRAEDMLSHFEEPPPTQSEPRIRGAMTKAAWVMRERAGVPAGTCHSAVP
jgi:hypothetical protein